MIKFHNTISGKIEEFIPLQPGKVLLYTCGPTVYDHAHIGNFRAYMFEDLLKRFLLFMGYQVTHVMNITDIDDKTIIGANAKGIDIQEYTKPFIDGFFQDIDRLNIQRADHYPRATEHIPEMVEIVQGLLDKGFAYKKNGSVYFDISKFPGYGKLSKIDLGQLKPGQRVESDEYEKENAVDFVLWKKNKENEPYWDTPFGEGRPGWHIECSAMSAKYLGESFDIHCGGVDNIFPHHENEIAQSEAYTGRKFVKYWIHCHHLIVDGEKMSKSKGNCYTLSDLLGQGADPMAIRLLLLSTHYRKMLNFTFDALEQAKASVQRMRDFLYELNNRSFPEGSNEEVAGHIEEAKKKFSAGLSDDLNISVSLTSFFEMIKKANILISENRLFRKDRDDLLSVIHEIDSVLGVLGEEEELTLSQEILDLIKKREDARKSNQYDLADRLRQELLTLGIILEDTPDGVRWKKAK
jgi:cysteinyl-tRNA synthetase